MGRELDLHGYVFCTTEVIDQNNDARFLGNMVAVHLLASTGFVMGWGGGFCAFGQNINLRNDGDELLSEIKKNVDREFAKIAFVHATVLFERIEGEGCPTENPAQVEQCRT